MDNLKWTQAELIAYECAKDCIAELISIYSSAVACEESNPIDDREWEFKIEAEISYLATERDGVHIFDVEKIALIRKEYGDRIKLFRKTGSLGFTR